MSFGPNHRSKRIGFNRLGFTLIEMVMVISVSGVLLVINALWIHQSLKYSSAVKLRQRQHQTLNRLADDFRRDMWVSDSVSRSSNDELTLTAEEGVTIHYMASSNVLSVEKHRSGTIFFRDQYRFAPGTIIRWETDELPKWVTLVIERGHLQLPESLESYPSLKNIDRPIDLRLRTAPGRWRRN